MIVLLDGRRPRAGGNARALPGGKRQRRSEGCNWCVADRDRTIARGRTGPCVQHGTRSSRAATGRRGSTASYTRADLIHGDLTSMLDSESSRAETGLSAPIARSRSEARSPGGPGERDRASAGPPSYDPSVHCCDVDWNSHVRAGATANGHSDIRQISSATAAESDLANHIARLRRPSGSTFRRPGRVPAFVRFFRTSLARRARRLQSQRRRHVNNVEPQQPKGFDSSSFR